MVRFLRKTIFLPKNFLNCRFGAFQKQSIVYLIPYGGKGYTLVVLGYFEATFLGEMEVPAFCPFVGAMLIYGVAVSELYVVEFFLFSILLEVFHTRR